MKAYDNHQKMTRAGVFALLLLIFIIAAGLYRVHRVRMVTPEEFRRTRFSMDTYIEITILALPKEKAEAVRAMDGGFSVFEDLDKKYSFTDKSSVLSSINKKTEVEITDPCLVRVIGEGLRASLDTNGAFDPTLGALKRIYPIGEEKPIPPDDNTIQRALASSGYRDVALVGSTLKKPATVEIDLGGILKGYAVEEAAKRIKAAGFRNFIVNGGGNIRAYGNAPNGSPWKVGVENPRANSGIIAVIPLENKAIATSGDYQRYFIYQGVRYHHILDGKTGKPARNAVSATVIAPDAMTADIYSTASFVMGREKGTELLEKKGLEGIITDEQGYSVTKGLKNRITVNYQPLLKK